MNELWYKEAIIYGLSVDAFQDSNGDGVGDFRGMIDRLDYLADLGITCIWLLPIYPSPNRDNGYDIKQHLEVDERYGTFNDFLEFMHKAGERGLRLLLDLVVNHTSDQHPWFQAARRDSSSRFHDYYIWTQSPPPTPKDAGNIVGEKTVWTWDETAGKLFYHRFYHFEPELDTSKQEVREELKRILDFWLSFGISGFRLDAASHMIEKKGLPSTAPGNPHGILKEMRAFIDQRKPGAVLLGEADVPPSRLADFFGEDDELQMLFNFLLNNYLMLALATEEAAPIVRCMELLPTIDVRGQWTNFLRNLDELDLERLGAGERARVQEVFAPEERMRIYGRGVRRRLAPMLDDQRRLKMAWSLLLSLPGTPLIVYGDEIGMGEDLSLPGRNSVRTPMQWSDEKNGGFSPADESRLERPVVSEGKFSYTEVNVRSQQNDPDSLLNWMKELFRLRREALECSHGRAKFLSSDSASVLVHQCSHQRRKMLFVHNLSGDAVKTTVTLDLYGAELEVLFGDGEIKQREKDDVTFRLPEYGFAWLRVHHA